MVRNSKMKRISLAVCLALMPFAADAAGLGKLTVFSGLGEPLNAEIEIAAEKAELSSLSARIAPAETYAEQGVERPATLGGIRVELVSKADGSAVLKLSTPQPVNEPFLDMLIQVDWPTGRLLREYTTLLDPPGYGEREQAAVPTAAVRETAPELPAPSKKNSSETPSTVAKAARKPASRPEAAPMEGGYVTRRGDTLRSIAKRMQPDDVSLEQTLVGLFRTNRNAFAGDNMNQLMAGKIIHAPREEELRALTQQDALQEIRVHTANWNAYRNNLAGAVAQSAPAQTEPAQQAVSGKITAQTEDKAAPAAPGPRDVVKLSKSAIAPAGAGTATGKGSAADDKLRTLEEESIAQDSAIKEVNERIAFFEKQIQDMQQLLLVQNQMLADLQKGKQPPAPVTQAPQPAAEAQQPAAATPAAPVEQAKPAAPAPKPPADVVAEPGPFDSLGQDPVLLGGAGGLLLLLGGAWLYLRGKRKKGLDSFEQGILTTGGLKSDTVFAATGTGAAEGKESPFLGGFARHDGEGVIDTSDVDPISEAEVYMAYGRDTQAEEILKDALAKEPKRYELHHKLLEVYASRKDVAAFETLAGELYASLGTTSPHWLKVAELGRALEPGNPMYAAAAAAPERAPVAEQLPAAEPAALAEPAAAQPAEVDDNSLDFDLGMLAAEEPQSEIGAESGMPEVAAEASLPELAPDVSAAEQPDAVETVEADAELETAFDLPEPAFPGNVQLDAADLGLSVEEAAVDAVAEPALELPELNFPETAGEPEIVLSAPETAESPAATLDVLAELPEPAAEQEADAASDISFDLPELADLEADIAAAAAQPEPVVVDLEPVSLPTAEPVITAEAVPPLELPIETSTDTAGEVEEIVIEQPAAEESGLDFDFDLDMGAETPPEPVSPAPAQPLPDLDLSAINLDLGESETSDAAAVDEITLSGAESPDVDTKLDLVTAYMDMGDSEGARELLEEVLREGGPQQRERAQKMLSSLS